MQTKNKPKVTKKSNGKIFNIVFQRSNCLKKTNKILNFKNKSRQSRSNVNVAVKENLTTSRTLQTRVFLQQWTSYHFDNNRYPLKLHRQVLLLIIKVWLSKFYYIVTYQKHSAPLLVFQDITSDKAFAVNTHVVSSIF